MGPVRLRTHFLTCAALVAPLLAIAPPLQATGLIGARNAAREIASGVAVTGASVERSGAGAKIVFDLNRPLAVEAYVLADPDRVVVELPETSFLIDPAIGREVAGRKKGEAPALVSGFRFGQFARGRSRIVFDLSGPARIVKAVAEPTASGGAARLVVGASPTRGASLAGIHVAARG